MVIFVQKSGSIKLSTENIEKKNDSIESYLALCPPDILTLAC